MSSKTRPNSILKNLPTRELTALAPDLQSVQLSKHRTLFESNRHSDVLYFPIDAVISFTESTGQGGKIEVWAVGRDGIAGISSLLGQANPFRGVVLIPGAALKAKSSTLRKHFQDHKHFHDAVLRYYHYLLIQVSYLGICNNSHPLVQRFSRWLLTMQERAGTKELRFTQDAIASMLGTRRATISVAAANLQAKGLISYTPGAIRIRSRRGLMNAACGCYKFVGPLRG